MRGARRPTKTQPRRNIFNFDILTSSASQQSIATEATLDATNKSVATESAAASSFFMGDGSGGDFDANGRVSNFQNDPPADPEIEIIFSSVPEETMPSKKGNTEKDPSAPRVAGTKPAKPAPARAAPAATPEAEAPAVSPSIKFGVPGKVSFSDNQQKSMPSNGSKSKSAAVARSNAGRKPAAPPIVGLKPTSPPKAGLKPVSPPNAGLKPMAPAYATDAPVPVAESAEALVAVPATEEGEEARFDVSQNAYSAAKHVWAWGKTVPVITDLLGIAEAATAKVLDATIHMDLPAVDQRAVTPQLRKLDNDVVTPIILAVWKIVGPAVSKGEELVVRPVLNDVVPRVLAPLGMSGDETKGERMRREEEEERAMIDASPTPEIVPAM